MKAIVAAPYLNDSRFYADSAIGRDLMPLFIPDFVPEGAEGWRCEAALAFRVERLGKNIPEKFGRRYLDAAGVVALLLPNADIQPSWLSIMDSAVTTGTWINIPKGDFTVKCGDEEYAVGAVDAVAAQAVSMVSTIATIKTGDIIIPPLPRIEIPLTLNSRVEVAINGTRVLTLKIK